MKNKDLKKYSIALSVLTLQMKSLRNMAVTRAGGTSANLPCYARHCKSNGDN